MIKKQKAQGDLTWQPAAADNCLLQSLTSKYFGAIFSSVWCASGQRSCASRSVLGLVWWFSQMYLWFSLVSVWCASGQRSCASRSVLGLVW
jgi:hypothetical protein